MIEIRKLIHSTIRKFYTYFGCRISGRERFKEILSLTKILKPFSLYAWSTCSASVIGYGFPCSPFPAEISKARSNLKTFHISTAELTEQ